MSGNQWGPPPGQQPQPPYGAQPQPFGGQQWQPGPQYGAPPPAAPYQGMPPQGPPYGGGPGGPQFGWGAPPGGPQPPRKKGGGAKAVFIVLGVVVLGGVALFGVANALNEDDSPTRPSYSSSRYTPTYRPVQSPSIKPTRTNGPVKITTATQPTAPRTTSTPKQKPGPTDSDLLLRNKLYSAGAMKSVGCKESRSRPTNVAGARANYATLLACLNRSWPALANKTGTQIRPPNVRMFSGRVSTPCGTKSDSGPPFYCGSTQTIYMNLTEDIGNYNRYSQPYQKVWARMWLLHQFAHEYGHHVQNRTGILAANYRMRYEAPTQAKELEHSRRLELQASCFADIFIGANRRTYPLSGESMRQWRWLIGHVTDLKNDHGDAGNHQYWAMRGFNSRNASSCNTYAASAAKVQ